MKNLINFILFFLPFGLFAQSVEKGFDLLREHKFPAAIEVFNKSIEKNKDVLACKYGLALIYSDTSYQRYKYDKAYRNLLYVEKQFQKIQAGEKSELKKACQLDEAEIVNLKNKILRNAFLEAKTKGTVDALTAFCEDFPNTEQFDMARQLILQVEFDNVVKQNSPAALNGFLARFPGSKYDDSAKVLLKQLEEKAYIYYSREGELESLLDFRKLYPNYKNKDVLQHEIEIAEEGFRLNMDEDYNKNMESFYISYIQKAAPKELAFVALQRIIGSYLFEKQWNNSIELLEKYKPLFQGDARIDKLINILKEPEKSLKIENLSTNINTEGHEYAPVLTADGNTLYFCGRNREGNIGGEDIFVSRFLDGEWTKPELLNSINTPYAHEAPLAISADGYKLLLYANTDIYYSDKLINGWAVPRSFPSVNNENWWEADACLTADGNAILFISDRAGNIGNIHRFGELFHGSHSGNSDIYVSVRQDDSWTKPVSLGKVINTPFSERSPFLHPDMKTLYFSSEGHTSLGRLDVFKSVRLNDTSWTDWSEPVSLGKEINTPGDEYDYKISTDGKYAYYSSFKSNNFDIQRLEIPVSVKPDYVATVWGTITNRNGQPVKTTLRWEDLKESKPIGILQSNDIDGQYTIILPLGKNYGYYIDDPNYYPLSGNLDLTVKKEQITIRKDFVLLSNSEIINEGVAVTLENVFFDFNKYDLKKESYSELNRLIAFLKKNENLKIEIAGHTDNIGSAEKNKKLSEQRANSVMSYLISKGISAERLVAVGFGFDKPVAANNTESGRSKNRRVEFKVIQK
ncbi:MAG: OmpA family protein [Bacteroidales bacterium]